MNLSVFGRDYFHCNLKQRTSGIKARLATEIDEIRQQIVQKFNNKMNERSYAQDVLMESHITRQHQCSEFIDFQHFRIEAEEIVNVSQ